jgi:putative membrane protein
MHVAFGPLTGHMVLHIALMNAGGLGLASVLAPRLPTAFGGPASIAIATVLQMALLWGWHAPPLLTGAGHTTMLAFLMPMSLLAAATWFWAAVLRATGGAGWGAVVALLVTSKLFCMLGVLYVFAPRVLYPELAAHGSSHHASSLPDQQLAGLLMLIACPVCYVLTGLRIASRLVDGHGASPLLVGRAPDIGRGDHADLP